jgi:hypothetical protein
MVWQLVVRARPRPCWSCSAASRSGSTSKAVNRTSSHTALSCNTVRRALLLDFTILSHPPQKCGDEGGGEKNAPPIAVLPFPLLLSYDPGCSHIQLPLGILRRFVSSCPSTAGVALPHNCWCTSDGDKTPESHDERSLICAQFQEKRPW